MTYFEDDQIIQKLKKKTELLNKMIIDNAVIIEPAQFICVN